MGVHAYFVYVRAHCVFMFRGTTWISFTVFGPTPSSCSCWSGVALLGESTTQQRTISRHFVVWSQPLPRVPLEHKALIPSMLWVFLWYFRTRSLNYNSLVSEWQAASRFAECSSSFLPHFGLARAVLFPSKSTENEVLSSREDLRDDDQSGI